MLLNFLLSFILLVTQVFGICFLFDYTRKMVKRSFSDAFSQLPVVAGLGVNSTKGKKRTHYSAFDEDDQMESLAKGKKRTHSSSFDEDDPMESLAKRFQECQVEEASAEPNLVLTSFFVDVLGNMMTEDIVSQGKNLDEMIDFAAKGKEWRHLFSSDLVCLLSHVAMLRSCSKSGTKMTERQQRDVFESFRRAKSFLFQRTLSEGE
jgi:hypothetical protein